MAEPATPPCPRCPDGGEPVPVIVPRIYPHPLFHRCLACHRAWHKWPEGTRARYLAEPHVKKNNRKESRR